jgi:hypothetical protein
MTSWVIGAQAQPAAEFIEFVAVLTHSVSALTLNF